MYKPSVALTNRIANTFMYHAPNEDQVQRYARIRREAYEFASMLSELCPESSELTLALRQLQGVVMFANAAIAINEAVPELKDGGIDAKAPAT